ncbi:DMT family transporter [Tropicimonas isoalkanivorans]|uniref:Threonine/homoserine efflux transporter RhtA n=1 Tax=Tropicimonas isoalkanivorans TaxID=441112 RepID=A0A1I1PYE5_9RHOB|nr:DMT family transporter [Tropicimonas isoalkanivorans]SFD14914.1 Threonine/homoserine efflux transporter RhtA [Tropicimonas isoalkanivorans]
MTKARVFFLLLILGTAFWGVSFSLVKVGVGDGSPFIFLAYKFALAALVLAIVFARRLRSLSPRALAAGVLIGLPLLLGNVFQTIGLQHTSVTNSAFITGLDVLIIPLFKWGLFRRPVQGRVWISCGLALLGLYMIVAQNGLRLNVGDLWTMACAVFFAAYVLTVGHFAHRYDPLQTVIVALAFCGAGCGLAGAFDARAIWMPVDMSFWRGIVFAALFATAFMYAVQSSAQRYIAEEKVALTYLCEPVFAALAGVLLLGEALTLRTVIGAGMILSAMVLPEIDLRALRSSGTPRQRIKA